VAVPSEAPPDPAGFLDGRILVPGIVAIFLLVAAPLLWAGTHGIVDGYLVLYWVGILAIVLGVALAFVVGVVPLAAISMGGIVWLLLERVALAIGSVFGWAAPVLLVIGALLLPDPARRLRAVVEERRAWARMKGGSVPP
jgi:hypothetical protein